MKIEIIDLTEKNLREAPEWDSPPFSCKYCIYWESPEECMELSKAGKEDMFEKKLRWLRDTGKIFGNCGKMIYVNGKPVGYAQYAPPDFLPNSTNYHSKPSADAVLISCLFISQKEIRRTGLGTNLLQSIIDDLRKRGIRAVETFARKGNPGNPSGPMEFYLRNGFKISKDDSDFPLMRLEL